MTQLANNRRSSLAAQHQQQRELRPKTTASSAASSTVASTSMCSSGSGTGGSECVKVVVRCRPLSETENSQRHANIVRMDAKQGMVEVLNSKESGQPAKCFTFDAVYDQNSKQVDIYDESVRGIVDSVLQGFNGTVFAYGQTGTGKTFTMEGIRGDPEQRGVIPNAIAHIFQHIAHSPPTQQYLVRASFLEIYQEEIRDLLDKNAGKRLELKERPDVGVYVKDLSSFVTMSVGEIEHVLAVGHSNRSVGQTNMNAHSSRSHAIFIITVECSETVAESGETHIRVGRLNLVDLAGSERQSKTGSEGDRFKEAIKINLSLSALGNVISALSDQRSAHIPYRDSKLTRLLQDSLGGNSKTVMISNVGPASYNYEETLNTLRYSSRAKQIQNRPRINEDPKDALLREFQDEIVRLKSMLEQKGGKKRTRRRLGKNGQETISENIERDAQEYMQEQQLKLEMERERLMRNSQMIEEEKMQLFHELEEREKELERERQAQLAVATKIRQMQSKLLSGDGNLLDRTRRQEEMLGQRRHELTEQKRREREISQKLEAHELETVEIKQTFASLQQEVEAKRKKISKLHTKLQQIRLELRDVNESNATERHYLEQTVLAMNKELSLKWLLIDNFVPSTVCDRVKASAIYDENEQKWLFLSANGQHLNAPILCDSVSGHPHSTSSFGCSAAANGLGINLLLSPQPHQQLLQTNTTTTTLADSGLGSSNGSGTCCSQGPNEDMPEEEMARSTIGARQQVPAIRRPMARSGGVRRPTTDWELSELARLRHHLVRQGPRGSTPQQRCATGIQNANSAEFVTVHEEKLRFCCENLLTFHRLLKCPSEVRHSMEDGAPAATKKPPSSAAIINCRLALGSASSCSSSALSSISVPASASSSSLATQRLVVDVSRIPLPSKGRRSSRDIGRHIADLTHRRNSLSRSLLDARNSTASSPSNNSINGINVHQQPVNAPKYSISQTKNLRARSVFSGMKMMAKAAAAAAETDGMEKSIRMAKGSQLLTARPPTASTSMKNISQQQKTAFSIGQRNGPSSIGARASSVPKKSMADGIAASALPRARGLIGGGGGGKSAERR